MTTVLVGPNAASTEADYVHWRAPEMVPFLT